MRSPPGKVGGISVNVHSQDEIHYITQFTKLRKRI